MKEPIIKPSHVGCLCCDGNGQTLDMDTRLYWGFGGYSVTKDGQHYFQDDGDSEWDENKTLQEIENEAALSPDSDWRVILMLPLRGGEWQRHEDGKWHLIKEDKGFA